MSGNSIRESRSTLILAAARAAGAKLDYEPGKGQITWASGSIARCFSADTPDALRGPEHDLAWCDELAAWRRADKVWSNLLLTLRIGLQPRIIATTTPRPTRLLRELVARDGTDGIVVRRITTYDNRANLAPQFFAQLVRRFEGTRLARQELLAELLEDVPGALWNRDLLESTRVDRAPEHLMRIVIGVDPGGSSAAGADLTGILVCGLGLDGEGYVLADLSRRGTPREWASAAIGAYHSLKADKIVIERNFGGEMAAATLASVDPAVPVKEVTSSRGKVLRAEPIASVFEQKRAHLVGALPELEDQMCSFTSDWNRARDGSPDRVDALVFAMSELMLTPAPSGFLVPAALLVDNQPVTPSFADRVWQILITVAHSDSRESAVGVIFWGYSPHHGIQRVPLLVLDYLLIELDELPRLFAQLYKRAQALSTEWRAAHSDIRVLVEAIELHEILAYTFPDDAAETCSLDLIAGTTWPATLDTRAKRIRAAVNIGTVVKLAQDAHGRQATHRGVTNAHLFHQLVGYEPEDGEAPAELFASFALGILWALSAGIRPADG